MGLLFKLREKLRFTRPVNAGVYLAQALLRSRKPHIALTSAQRRQAAAQGKGIALCLRFRNEALYIAEWLEYHLAAGADHFFLYNNFSTDDFLPAIQPYLDAGVATLIDWPKAPASPAAEEDCVQRAMGRFAWVGFIDADEFVVVRDGRSMLEFLEEYRRYPAVCLHWRMFGSSGHRTRPASAVIEAYTMRALRTDYHVKSFVQPHRVTECKNPHSWFYKNFAVARGEKHQPIFGSIGVRPTSEIAWLNHFYCKSEEDYIAKASYKTAGDSLAMKVPHRRVEYVTAEMQKNNEFRDESSIEYYVTRCQRSGRRPVLLQQKAAVG